MCSVKQELPEQRGCCEFPAALVLYGGLDLGPVRPRPAQEAAVCLKTTLYTSSVGPQSCCQSQLGLQALIPLSSGPGSTPDSTAKPGLRSPQILFSRCLCWRSSSTNHASGFWTHLCSRYGSFLNLAHTQICPDPSSC